MKDSGFSFKKQMSFGLLKTGFFSWRHCGQKQTKIFKIVTNPASDSTYLPAEGPSKVAGSAGRAVTQFRRT